MADTPIVQQDDPNALAAPPAPELETTAPPAPEIETPDDPPAESPKTFTQEELDEIIAKRVSREKRKFEREYAERQALAQPPAASANPPQIDDFDTPEAYAQALAYQQADVIAQQREEARRQHESRAAFDDRAEAARDKYADYDQIVQNPNLPVSTVMAEAIMAADNGPELAYWLGTNPTEARRIASLSPVLQAREIGKLEAKLASEPPVKKTSTAPAPIAPITARQNGRPALDTTDPRSTKEMSTSEWIAAERQRQIRLMEPRNR